jgi:hypothetical protein
VAGEHRFHLGRIDLQTAAVDHVLLAVEDAHEALRVDRAEIAGAPEASDEILGRRGRIAPVAFDDRAAVNPDFADLAGRAFMPIVVHGDDARAGTGEADAVGMRRGIRAGAACVEGEVVSVAP